MEKFITACIEVGVGETEVISETGLFKKTRTPVKVPDPKSVNYNDLARKIKEKYDEFDRSGYDVINVIPLALGSSESVNAVMNSSGAKTYLGETGFSITRGVILVGRRRV